MKEFYKFVERNSWMLYALLAIAIIFVWISVKFSPAPTQTQYIDLANSFIHERLYFIPPLRVFDDFASIDGRVYNYFGPAPAVFLLPFVLIFGINFPQIMLSLFATVVNFFAIYKITKAYGILKEHDALWLTGFFLFGTLYIFLAVTNVTAFTVQVFGLAFINLALYFFFTKRSLWLVGICIAIAGMTRFTLFLGSIFFLLEFYETLMFDKKKLLSFFLPLAIAVGLLFAYNFARFHNPLETGYGYTVTNNTIYRAEKSHGIFNLIHVPGNLYFLLFKGPDAVRADDTTYILKFPYLRVNEWGLGLFFSSPLFLYILFVKLKDKHVLSSLITTGCMLIPVLMYYNSGLWQYGYRYALDFYPFLFLLLLSQFKERLPIRAKILIIYSIIFIMCFMYSIWNIYPFPITN